MQAQPGWRCLACRAVGTQVTMRDNAKNKSNAAAKTETPKEETLITVQMEQRPTECCLCSVNDGTEWYHAMHPVYDRAGRTALPLMLPPTREHAFARPAWAHTLCCYAIYTHAQTAGCVFACFADGSFPAADGKVDGNHGNINSMLEEKDPLDDSVHHFGYSLPGSNADGSDDLWSEKIQELQQNLKCFICRKPDKNASSYRIPVYCSANESYEIKEYRTTHTTQKGKGNSKRLPRSCTTAMHIGCAIWGGRRNKPDFQLSGCRRVSFLPGQTNTSGGVLHETFIHNYCDTHASDLYTQAASGAELLRYPKGMRVAPRPDVTMAVAPRPAKRSGQHKMMQPAIRSPRIPRKKNRDARKKSGWFAEDSSCSSSSLHNDVDEEEECDIGTSDVDVNDEEYEATVEAAEGDDDHNLDDLLPAPEEQEDDDDHVLLPTPDDNDKKEVPVPQELPIAAAQELDRNNNGNERIMSDQEQLARAIANEIMEEERNRGDYHCQQLLETARNNWSDRVEDQDAEVVWNEVDKVLLDELGYTAEETDWTDGGDTDENTTTIALNMKEWDTVEVLSIGPPPCGLEED